MSLIAVASRSFSRHPVLREELLAEFPDVRFNDAGASLAGADLIGHLAGAERAVIALEKITDDILAQLPDLKVVAKYGVGLDNLDLAAMRRRGIQLGWTGGVNRRSVSELVVSAAIVLLRHVPQAAAEVRAGTWRQLMGRQLTGKTVGIVGCGHVGKDLVLLLKAFDCDILAHDIKDFPDFYATHGVKPVDLDTLVSVADIVTLHTPCDETTRNMIGAERIKRMKPGAVLINAARGGLVDEAAVKTALISGHLGGAAFDVFAKEPPEDLDLARLPNVIAMPHIGGSSEEAVLAMGRAAITGLTRFGDPLEIAGLSPG